MIQASAGTGKSFLLTTVFLWAIVNGMECRAAAPTGIAAALGLLGNAGGVAIGNVTLLTLFLRVQLYASVTFPTCPIRFHHIPAPMGVLQTTFL